MAQTKKTTGAKTATAPAAAPTSSAAAIPAEIQGWNWGAFFLTWIWGIGNSVWIALVALAGFIPYLGWLVSIGMAIFLGIKGNELAWRAKQWESVEAFKKTQKTWAIAGVIVFVAGILLSILMFSALAALLFGLGSSGALDNSSNFEYNY